MNRRAFLTALVAAPAALAFDPERALWMPGKKLISIPAPRAIAIAYKFHGHTFYATRRLFTRTPATISGLCPVGLPPSKPIGEGLAAHKIVCYGSKTI